MKTIETTLFRFDELSEEAKERAINARRNAEYWDSWEGERNKSYRCAKSIFEKLEGIESEISGARLYTWIQNNLSHYWLRDTWYCKKEGKLIADHWSYKYATKARRSRIKLINDIEGCPLTGVCYDCDFLEDIIKFLKKPEATTSNLDLVRWFQDVPEKIAQRDYEWYYSDEFIKEELENCEDEKYLADGSEF